MIFHLTELLAKVGIISGTSVVFGYPMETRETIKETFDMCSQANVYPSIGFLLPLPMTPMYQYAKEHGFIDDDDEFLDSITERQDICLNMTNIPDADVMNIIVEEAEILQDKLNLKLKNPIKTEDGHTNKDKQIKRKRNDVSFNYSESEFDFEESNISIEVDNIS